MASKKRVTVWKETPNRHPAISTSTSRQDLTGSWRFLRPNYRNLLPPCNHGCPAGNDIRGFIELALQEKWQEGFDLISKTSPFPSVCGRVCYHPCETQCNRKEFDEPIAIHSIERHIGELARTRDFPRMKKRGKKTVAIVGSGPAGLSCAYHLARRGIASVVFESLGQPGGLLYYGIPSYRLPKDVLGDEVSRIERMGVSIKLNTYMDKAALTDLQKNHAAVFLAFGAHGEQKMGAEGENLEGVYAGLQYLKRINAGENLSPRPRVLVVGGGNTAMDVARSVMRLGAHATVLYRRTEAEMPAHPDEIAEAREEGVDIIFLAAPHRIIDRKGHVVAVECQKMKLGRPDSSGRRRPEPIEGETFTIETDMVFTAIGERPELDPVDGLLDLKWNRIARDAEGRTSLKGVFCGGDTATDAAGTVVSAIGDGRRAATAIESLLYRQSSAEEAQKIDVVTYEMLNIDYFSRSPRVKPPHLHLHERQNFQEVVHGLDVADAVAEAKRCFSCGVCNFCLNCRKFCPDSAITYRDGCLEIDYNYCKGCGVCVTECPRNAMCLEEER